MFNSFSSKYSPLSGAKASANFSPTQLPNLLAWYDMSAIGLANGAAVSTVPDSSGNGFHLNGGGASYVTSDLNFSGNPSIEGQFTYTRNPAAGTFIQGNEPFAMYAVVRKTGGTGWYYGMSFGFGANGNASAAIFTYADYVAGVGGYYVDFSGTGTGGSFGSPLNTPYILQYSYGGGDRGIYPFYQNATAHTTGAAGGNLNIQNQEIRLGGKPGYAFSFEGSIAEVIVYKAYHDATTIAKVRDYLNNKYKSIDFQGSTLVNLDAGNLTSYPGSGNTWYDLSGNNNHATLLNGYTLGNDGFDNYLTFDGVSGYASGTNNYTTNIYKGSDTLALESFFRITGATTDWVRIIGKGDNSNRTYGLWYNDILSPNKTLIQRLSYGGGNTFAEASTNLNLNTWYHLFSVSAPNIQKLYLNGTLVASTNTSSPNFFQSSNPFTIGYAGFHTYHKGDVAVARMYYGKNYSDAEVLQKYNELKVRYGVP